MKKFILIFLLLIFLGICKSHHTGKQIQLPVPEIESVAIKKNWGECLGKPGSPCLTVQIEYPVIHAGQPETEAKISNQIAKMVKEALLYPDDGRENPLTVSEIADLLLIDYQNFVAEDSSFSEPWRIIIKGDVILLTGECLTIKMQQLHDLGGSRPREFMRIQSFSLKTGLPIQLSDLSLDKEVLIEAALKIAGSSKKRHSIFAPKEINSIFTDDANFGLTENGLLFIINPLHYNVYKNEYFEFAIPWSDLPDTPEVRSLYDH